MATAVIEPVVRAAPVFRKGRERLQNVFINCAAVRKEVREDGRTFQNLADYLAKYHGFKHFDLVVGGKREGPVWAITIRRKGLLERVLHPSPDGKVWEAKKANG